MIIRVALAKAPFNIHIRSGETLRDHTELLQMASRLKLAFLDQVAKDLQEHLSNYRHDTPSEQIKLWKALANAGIEPITFFEYSSRKVTGSMIPAPSLLFPDEPREEHLEFRRFKEAVRKLDGELEMLLYADAETVTIGSETPFKSQEARLYSLMAMNPGNVPYLAVSKLMGRCRGWWLDELKQMPQQYVTQARDVFYASLTHFPKNSVVGSIIDPAHHYFLSMSVALAGIPYPDERNEFSWQIPRKKTKGIQNLDFDDERTVTLAATALVGGSVQGSASILDALVSNPVHFAQALYVGGQDNDRALYFAKVCLYVHIINTLPSPQEILDLVEEFREAFLDYGYSDILRTQAIESVVCHLDAAELFEERGYFRCEDMGIDTAFCRTFIDAKHEFDSRIGHLDPTETHRERAVILAMKLGQGEMLKKAAKQFFDGNAPEKSMLHHPAAMRIYIESDEFQPKGIINSQVKADAALKMGVDRQKFLRHSVLRKYASSALEIDLGL
jgi:hypothetical protein